MSGKRFGVLILLAVAALTAAEPCRADLFAAIPGQNEILRIDTATGNVTDTIEIPDWITNSQPTPIGLAYDGRSILTLNVRRGEFDEAWQTDVTFSEAWWPAGILQSVGPADSTPAITGMGMTPDPLFGGYLLFTVSQWTAMVPSYIQQHVAPIVPFPPDTFSPLDSAVPLPPNLSALGADIDPTTGALWVAVDEIVDGVNVPHLVRADIATGAILQTLTPSNSASPIRGVGFDGGAMYVGVRNLPALANEIYEVDRTTGAVLRTITLPANKLIGGLAGGPVIPEPGTGLLMALGVVSAMAVRRKRDRRN